MDAISARLLRLLRRSCTRAELKALFATVRAESDERLLLVEERPRSGPNRREHWEPSAGARDVVTRLDPILAPAAEKAGMLIDALAEAGLTEALTIRVDGLLPTVRRLCNRFGETAVKGAADRLAERSASWGAREHVK